MVPGEWSPPRGPLTSPFEVLMRLVDLRRGGADGVKG